MTTGVVLIKEHAERVKPPRMLAVPFNFGNTLGEANNPDYQHEVLEATFALLDHNSGPVLQQFETGPIPDPIVQGSHVINTSASKRFKAEEEVRSFIDYYERWLSLNLGRTGVGLSTIPYGDFGKMANFLEGYIEGTTSDMPERPTQFSLAHFIRYCVDDLKSFCFESRMAQKPNITVNALHEWFWVETSVARLILRLEKRMASDDNEEIKAEAYSIAR